MNVSKLLISMLFMAPLSSACVKRSDIHLPQNSQKNGFPIISPIDHDKEQELRKALAEIREAIKEYKTVCEEGLVGPFDRRKDDQCYPPTLESLVEGIRPPKKKYYLQF